MKKRWLRFQTQVNYTNSNDCTIFSQILLSFILRLSVHHANNLTIQFCVTVPREDRNTQRGKTLKTTFVILKSLTWYLNEYNTIFGSFSTWIIFYTAELITWNTMRTLTGITLNFETFDQIQQFTWFINATFWSIVQKLTNFFALLFLLTFLRLLLRVFSAVWSFCGCGRGTEDARLCAWNLPKILSFRTGILGGGFAKLWKAADVRGRRDLLTRSGLGRHRKKSSRNHGVIGVDAWLFCLFLNCQCAQGDVNYTLPHRAA